MKINGRTPQSPDNFEGKPCQSTANYNPTLPFEEAPRLAAPHARDARS